MYWDLFCKALFKECAQDFIDYFLPGARFIAMRECQLQTKVDGPFDPREIRADVVPEVERDGQRLLLNVEWQSAKHGKMGDRLLDYSNELTRLHDLSVRSAVIYTQPVSNVPRAPLIRSITGPDLPGGNVAIWFYYVSVELSEQPVETLRELDRDGFAVLMLLCKDGNTPAILDEVLHRLFQKREKRSESIATAFFFASQVFEAPEDKEFLKRRYQMLGYEIENNWFYQHVLSEGLAKGLKQGIEQGIEQGREQGIEQGREQGIEQGIEQGREQGLKQGVLKGHVEGARTSMKLFVEKRFPDALTWVTAQIERINDVQLLEDMMDKLFAANTEDEVRAALTTRYASEESGL